VKHRFLIHEVNHTILLVDISTVGLPTEIYPPEGKRQELSSLRFQSWESAEQFLQERGATSDCLSRTQEWLRKSSVAIVTIAR
jgi:hypothetical protein